MGYELFGRVHTGCVRLARRVQWRGERGQGTVEYVALIVLVAVVLAGVVAATRKTSIGDQGIAKTIVGKLKAAIEDVTKK